METDGKNAEQTAKKQRVIGKPFVKGQSGNPNGRPRGSISIVEALKRKLEEVPEGKEKTYLEYFIEQVMKKTIIEGDVQMMKDLINRVDGMPIQKLAGADGGAILIQISKEIADKNEITQNTSDCGEGQTPV